MTNSINEPAMTPSIFLPKSKTAALWVAIGTWTLSAVLPAAAHAAQSCTLRLSSALLDFGSTHRAVLLERSSDSTTASFGTRRTQLKVQCDAPQPMKLRLDASVADAQHYRFGTGTLQVRILAAWLDGVVVEWSREGEEGGLNPQMLRPGDRIMPWRNGAVALGRQLDLELEVEARVGREATRVRDSTRFESQGNFSVD